VTFTGFGEHAIEFYDGLLADNSKAYWEDNLAIYRTHIRQPMHELLAELTPEFGTDFGSAKVFRPYRDVRFARDKSLYKTQCGAVIEQARGAGAYYVEVGPDGLRVGGGCFHLESDQLARFRQAVDNELQGHALARIVTKLVKSGWTIAGDVLRTKPRGFTEDHPRIDLLRHRSLYAFRVWEPDDMVHQSEALQRVRHAWRELRPINLWAQDHVGVSEKPHR
jgi:uncharacterized protein (TIGR02453 family)